MLTGLCFLLFWMILEYAIGQVSNQYSYKYNYIKNNPSIKTLLIGHSHFADGINPYLMGDSVFDFATSGRGWLYFDVKLAEQLYPTMPNLKTVIFPLSYAVPYESPHYKEIDEGMKIRLYVYSKYMHVPYDIFPQKYIYSSALICNQLGLSCWLKQSVDSLGYEKRLGKTTNWQYMHNINPDIFKGDTATLCYKEYKNYLIDLAKICYDNNIRFIAVTCPCADCYIANTRQVGIDNLYALVDSVRAQYPIEYKNYMNDPEFRADSLYYNSSHLNSIGADLFAIRVKKDFDL